MDDKGKVSEWGFWVDLYIICQIFFCLWSAVAGVVFFHPYRDAETTLLPDVLHV